MYCIQCGSSVLEGAKFCKKCGVPILEYTQPANSKSIKATKSKSKNSGWLVLIVVIAIFAATGQFSDNNSDKEKPASAITSKPASSIKPVETELEKSKRLGTTWTYHEAPDNMSKGTVKTAAVNSLNVLSFGFPYQGTQRATLSLRKHPRHGNDVILAIQQGQFVCRSINSCYVLIRFDDGKAQRFTYSEPTDLSTTVIFIHGYDHILSSLRNSNKAIIETQFYQEGNQTLEFNTSNLKW